ncbi:hypothetical protein A7982_12777 [Minicystis rosea]|nr:hypothetical protein A7982_12777 [Minicystis rosea]
MKKASVASRIASLGLFAGLLLRGLAGCGGDSPDTSTGSVSGSGGGTVGSGGASTTGTGGHGGAPLSGSIDFFDGWPVDVSADGKIAVVEDVGSPELDLYFYDVATGTLEKKTTVGDPSIDSAYKVSNTGRVAAAYHVPATASVWSEETGWFDLGAPYAEGCDVQKASAYDISADGKVAVGMVWHGCSPEAFRWTDTGGQGTFTVLQIIGSVIPDLPQTAPTNRATVVSDDGQVAAGFAMNGNLDRSPAVWNADGTGFLLDPNKMDAPGEIISISADGKTLGGVWGQSGFLWTKDGGTVMLDRPPGNEATDSLYPNSIVAGGKLVFGTCGDFWQKEPTAFVWTAGKTRALQDVVSESGVAIPAGYKLYSAYSASADGSVVLGGAYDPDGFQKSFILKLPASAYGISP